MGNFERRRAASSNGSVSFPLGELLGVEMHSHVVPGIDDGSPDMATSLRLINGLVQLGYSRIITTPHIKADLYPNTKGSIDIPFRQLKASLVANNIETPISFAAEYMTDSDFGQIVANDLLLSLGNKHILIETGFSACPHNFEVDLLEVQRKGFVAILAHPERYRYIDSLDDYGLFKENNMLFQVNILSFTGYYGEKPQSLAIELLEAGMIDMLGTDLHNERQLAALLDFNVDRKVLDLISKTDFKNRNLLSAE